MIRLAAILAATLVAGAALAQNATVEFVNNSNATVYRLYMSSANTDSWEADLLGEDVLAPGRSFTVTRANMSGCLYDVLIEWESGARETDTFDLCAYGRYVIN